MKKYVKPIMQCEEYVASESVAACWTIDCNVPSGYGYLELNGEEGYQEYYFDWTKKDDYFIASGHGCGETHESSGIDATGPSANAMWHDNNTGEDYAVFYFRARGEASSKHHFCTLDSVNWAPNPNASN